MRDLEVAVGDVVVADQPEAVRPRGDGGVLADVDAADHSVDNSGPCVGAGYVPAVRDLKVTVGRIVVAD